MKLVKSDFCGELLEVLNTEEYQEISVITAEDIKPTKGHYHKKTDEIYWILRGNIELLLHDILKNKTWTEDLNDRDLFIVRKGVHHRIKTSSERNKICVISHPRWEKEDEHKSELI